MTIYVDQVTIHKSGEWSHMITDGDLEELHAMAITIGLKRNYFQNKHSRYPHYDVRPTKRTMAIQLGAKVVSSKELISILKGEKC